MRKFVINVRKGTTTIMEVECEVVTPLQDSSIMFLKPGEWKGSITAPQSLMVRVEKIVDGKKESNFIPDVYCWHAFYDTVEAAQTEVAKMTRHEMQVFAANKRRPVATEEEVQAAIAEVKVVMLKA